MIKMSARVFLFFTIFGKLINHVSTNIIEQSSVSTVTEIDYTENLITQSTTNPWGSFQELKKQFDSDLYILLKEAEPCRKNYSTLTDSMFKLKLYSFLLNQLTEKPIEGLVFHCDINTKLVDSLRDKLQNLEKFQKSFVENPKNNSTKSPTKPQGELEREVDSTEILEEGNDLRLKEEEWKTNVPHVSHIYLGRSMYPMITEESRVIESQPKPQIQKSSTAKSFTKGIELYDLYTVEEVYKMLSPMRWSKRAKPRGLVRRDLSDAWNMISRGFRRLFFGEQKAAKKEEKTEEKMTSDDPVATENMAATENSPTTPETDFYENQY